MITDIGQSVNAQTVCNDYNDGLDESVTRLFTSERSKDSREMAFTSAVHNVAASQVRRLNLPEEQWICDTILNKIWFYGKPCG